VLPVSAETRTALGLAALLATAGTTHFAMPKFYDTMIPDQLPGAPRTWTYGSGAAELVVATALVLPATRRHGAAAAAVLFAGVLPGNVKMAIDARTSDSTAFRVGTILRLPMQLPLIGWALRVRNQAR
jgi:uncharacterized membrane protein